MPCSRWAAFRSSSRDERRQFIRALVLLPIVVASLRGLGLRRTRAWLARGNTSSRRPADERAAVRTALTAVRRAQRHGLVEGACLSRSLVLQRLLAREGVATDLRFGVRRDVAAFEAHAWIELRGAPIGEAGSAQRTMAMLRATPGSGAAPQTPRRPESSA